MLSDAKIRAAKARDKAYKLTDSHRLYLLVKPNGSKLWKWNYAYDGKQKTMAFGIYPMVSLVNARAKRDDARALLDEGKDPSVVKKLRIEANLEAGRNTFERVAREWHENAKAQWAAIHADDVLRSLERDVFPLIGDLPISELTAPKILEALKSIEDRGAIETAPQRTPTGHHRSWTFAADDKRCRRGLCSPNHPSCTSVAGVDGGAA